MLLKLLDFIIPFELSASSFGQIIQNCSTLRVSIPHLWWKVQNLGLSRNDCVNRGPHKLWSALINQMCPSWGNISVHCYTLGLNEDQFSKRSETEMSLINGTRWCNVFNKALLCEIKAFTFLEWDGVSHFGRKIIILTYKHVLYCPAAYLFPFISPKFSSVVSYGQLVCLLAH